MSTQLSRRDFLGQSVLAVSALAATNLVSRADDNPRKLKSGADQVTLGKSGVKTSLIGMGTGTSIPHLRPILPGARWRAWFCDGTERITSWG